LQTSIVSTGGAGNDRDGGSASHQKCVHAPGRGYTAAGRRQWASVNAPAVRHEPRSEIQDAISPDMALRLAAWLGEQRGGRAELWLTQQMAFDVCKARQKSRPEIASIPSA